MFDIAFSEIMVIAVVALIVIGPEKLPKTARTLGHLYGRLRRYVTDVKADISREMDLEELRKLQREVHSAAKEIETSMSATVGQIESNVRTVEAELNNAAALADAPAEAPAVEAPAYMQPPASEASTGAPDFDAVSTQPAPAPNQGNVAVTAIESPRQATLPGLERP